MKNVYLTIDDSPSKDMKEKVDYLFSKKIPAIFFCIGKRIEKNERPVVYAIKKGFWIGNHSYSHPFFSRIDTAEVSLEVGKTDKLIESCYKKSGKKRPLKLFRFPYGDKGDKVGSAVSWGILSKLRVFNALFGKKKKNEIQKILISLGYRQPMFRGISYPYFRKHGLDKDADVFWTFDFEEYRLPLEKVFLNMDRKLNEDSNEILLVHDHDNTKEEFFRIVDKLIGKRFKFVLPV